MGELIISKLDAARRQLETAVRLFFSEADPVSIHTLTAAAYQVIHDINTKQGGEPMFVKGAGLQMVKPEHRSFMVTKINEAENFFKHANRDPNETLKFNPEFSEFMMLDACDKYRSLTGEIVPKFLVFISWFELQHPDLLKEPNEHDSVRVALKSSRAFNTRAGYYAMALPAISHLQVNASTPRSPLARP